MTDFFIRRLSRHPLHRLARPSAVLVYSLVLVTRFARSLSDRDEDEPR